MTQIKSNKLYRLTKVANVHLSQCVTYINGKGMRKGSEFSGNKALWISRSTSGGRAWETAWGQNNHNRNKGQCCFCEQTITFPKFSLEQAWVSLSVCVCWWVCERQNVSLQMAQTVKLAHACTIPRSFVNRERIANIVNLFYGLVITDTTFTKSVVLFSVWQTTGWLRSFC